MFHSVQWSILCIVRRKTLRLIDTIRSRQSRLPILTFYSRGTFFKSYYNNFQLQRQARIFFVKDKLLSIFFLYPLDFPFSIENWSLSKEASLRAARAFVILLFRLFFSLQMFLHEFFSFFLNLAWSAGLFPTRTFKFPLWNMPRLPSLQRDYIWCPNCVTRVFCGPPRGEIHDIGIGSSEQTLPTSGKTISVRDVNGTVLLPPVRFITFMETAACASRFFLRTRVTLLQCTYTSLFTQPQMHVYSDNTYRRQEYIVVVKCTHNQHSAT